MDVARDTYRGGERHVLGFGGDIDGKRPLKDLGIDGRMILK
jgi:hypothetical protein